MTANFGHHGYHSHGVHIDVWGDGPLIMRDGKRKWRFEFSEMFGPTWLKTDGDPSDKQPICKKNPFWGPFQRWMHGGKKCRAVKCKRGRFLFYACHVPKEGLP